MENDEQNVLQHLLALEANAAALVNDAQAEADRRIAEAEKGNRARYEESYSTEAALLNQAYEKEIAGVKEDYRLKLDAYRQSLIGMPVDTGAFSRLLETCLLKAH